MRRTILLFFFLNLVYAARATECVDKVFQEQKLNVYLCQNYSNYKETTSLLFKARAKVLDNYIKEKIKKGQIKDKKFEIQIYDEVLSNRHLELTQDKSGYFIQLSGFPTLEQLIIFVDYFAKPDWKPFRTSDYPNASNENIAKQIDSFLADNAVANKSLRSSYNFPVWKQDELHLDYSNDKLVYFIGVTPLSVAATSSLPVKIKDRFLLFQHDTIFVLQGRQIIQKLKIDEPIYEDYDIYAFDKWVNICSGGKDNWVYSYCYKKNTFYKRR
jgi:hypothetical protein